MLKNVVIITVLVISLLTSMPAAYVFAVEEESKTKTETKSETSQDNPSNTGKPDVSPTPGETNDAKKNTVNPKFPTCDGTLQDCQDGGSKSLPKCDGSFQDCTTRNGDTCKAGEGGEKCECAPDNSDCQKNPNVNPSTKNNTPDKSCDFNPNADKCKPDKDGNCPPGFSHNDKGNCHPSGPCPSGFFRHTDDESGKCFPIHKDKHDNSKNHDTNNDNNSGNKCFDTIKTAWIGKITRGDNSRLDSIIDNCLNIK